MHVARDERFFSRRAGDRFQDSLDLFPEFGRCDGHQPGADRVRRASQQVAEELERKVGKSEEELGMLERSEQDDKRSLRQLEKEREELHELEWLQRHVQIRYRDRSISATTDGGQEVHPKIRLGGVEISRPRLTGDAPDRQEPHLERRQRSMNVDFYRGRQRNTA